MKSRSRPISALSTEEVIYNGLKKILSGEEGYVEKYKKMLSLGRTKDSIELLKMVLDIEDKYIDSNGIEKSAIDIDIGKGLLIIKGEIFNGNDFDKMRKIILEQNEKRLRCSLLLNNTSILTCR